MNTLIINDLPHDATLDRAAMRDIHGSGGAPWVYGWITPYVDQSASMGPVVNIFETNNTFNAGQMINQFQNVDVHNSGANSNIAVGPDERSVNRA